MADVQSKRDRELRGVRAIPGAVLGYGFFNRVWTLQERCVIKEGKTFGALKQPLDWLIRNRREHELCVRWVRIPPTYHVRLRDSNGIPVSIILQRRLHGRPLCEAPDTELYGAAMRGEVQKLVDDLDRCERELGFLPDVIGGPPRWGMHDVRRSNNYLVEDSGRIWLIDPGAVFFWFSSRNPIGWLYTRLLILSARRMARRSRKGL